MQYLLAFIAFNFIIIIHELGHFVVARMSGIKVLEFSLFIGPKIFSIKRGETQYSFRLIPLLAYVKMEGEEEASESERSFGKKGPLTRAAVIAAGPLVNLFAAIIILTIVFSISGFSTTKISDIGTDSPATAIGMQKDDKIIGYDGKSVYQPIDLISFVYVSKGKPAEIEILRGNETFTKTITPKVIPANRYILGFSSRQGTVEDSNVVGNVTADSPAAKINLQPGDRLVKLNDKNVSNIDEIRDYLHANKENPVKVSVLRNGSLVELGSAVPTMEKSPEQYDLGVAFKMEKGSVFTSLKQSVIYTYSVVRNVAYTITWLVTGKVALGQLSGPVGIFTTISTVVEQTTEPFSVILLRLLNITALLSIAIGASNLLPIPPADGSKLVLIAVEGIRGKPLTMERESSIMMVGFFIMIGLMIFITFNDVIKLFTGG